MTGKAILEIIGGFLFFSGVADTIYQLINWDSDYFELAKNIVLVLFGISLVTEWRKNRDGELMTDEQDKKEDKDGIS